ncbi:MAG: glycosyltransferase [Lachnospiraceae bacterium]|nr:glycosyltransferase [Lachnospiraceae bacterium]
MISVIVPIYNVKKYLKKCIESICGQTYKDLEIILVDDGSYDGSAEICDLYQKKDDRITVLHKKNEGLVSARKSGMQASHGRYIAYVDGDDWIESGMFERLYDKMTESNADIVMCGHFNDTGGISQEAYHDMPDGYYGKKKLLGSVYPKMIADKAFFDWKIYPALWDKLFKRESIEPYQMSVDEKIKMGEDAACTYPALLNAESIYILHECMYHYRQTTTSMVKNVQDSAKEREQFQVLYRSVNKSLEQYKDIFDLRDQWMKYVLFLMIPRSDGLYRGYAELDFLFPFKDVHKGMSVILYGAGTYGQRLYWYLEQTEFCNVVLWIDRNYIELQKMGLAVENPEELSKSECNTVVIANTYDNSRKGLYNELTKKYPGKKICMIDKQLIFSKETREAFGLIG